MTTPIWPSSLPQRVLRDGYSEQSQDGRLFTRTSAGPPKLRRRYSRVLKTVPASVVITYEEKAILEQFAEEETVGGSVPFLIPDQSHDDISFGDEDSDFLMDENGDYLVDKANWLVIFAQNELPRYEPFGVQWKASFTLTVLP